MTAEPRIEVPEPNTITRPYRGLSVQEIDVPLTPEAIGDLLGGREIYRRTAYLVLRRGGQTALVAVRPEDPDRLFSPVAELRVLSGPEATAWIEAPETDVGNATALAAAALAHRRARGDARGDDSDSGVLAYVVQGRYEHVNFIWRPAPVPVLVTEVVPPHPPKLLAMAEQVVGFDEDLPPVDLALDAVDVREPGGGQPGAALPAPVPRQRPAGRPGGQLPGHATRRYHPDWLLIGCERSRQFHEHFYGADPRRVDLCPKARAGLADPAGPRVLTKCCLLERGIEVDGATAVVPWGANLDEVRAALRALCGLPPVAVPGPGS